MNIFSFILFSILLQCYLTLSEKKCPLVNELDILRFFGENSTMESWVRPVKNFSQPVAVSISFTFRNIIEVAEKNQEFYVQGYVYLTWFDEFRIWNDTFPLHCIDTVVMPFGHNTKIWTPNIFFSNSRQPYDKFQDPNELIRVRKDGQVSQAPGGVYQSFCKLNLYLFPYDVQKCLLVFESWRYTADKQFFQNRRIGTDGDTVLSSEQWTIVRLHVHNHTEKYATGQFDRAIFEFVIKRKSEYFALTVIVPCLIIGSIELLTFLVPYDETVRLELSFTCFLAYTMFQTMVTSQLPQSAERPPLLLFLISLFTVYIGLAIFFQGICIYLHDLSKQDHETKPGQFLQRFVGRVSYLGVINVKKRSDATTGNRGIFLKNDQRNGQHEMPDAYRGKYLPS